MKKTEEFIKELEEFGFKENKCYPNSFHDREWWHSWKDEAGKKFLVLVKLWGFSKYSTEERKVEDSWSAEGYFHLPDDEHFWVNLVVGNKTPQEVMDWFHNVWVNMKCRYYEVREQ